MRTSWILAVVAVLLVCKPALSAWRIEPGIGAGMLYSNNVKFAPDNEDDDIVGLGYLGAAINKYDGPLRASISSSVIYENYLDDTYGDKYNVNLAAIAGWEMIRERVDWVAQDYFRQTAIDSLDPNTPDNRQNTNAFTFGPDLAFPFSDRHTLTVSPRFQDYYYENSNTDNRQYSINADWLYQVNRELRAGLGGGTKRVYYDDEDENPNYDTSNLGLILSGTRPRSQYTANLGGTYVRRDDRENQRGVTGNLSWRYELTGHSSLQAYLGTELRDSSVALLKSETDPEEGDFSNEQVTGDVARNNIFRMTYTRVDSTLNVDAWTEIRDLDYKEANDDRNVREIGTNLDYTISPLLTTGATLRYNRTKQKDTDRKDDTYVVGANLVYRLSRDLRTRFELRYNKRDSSQADDEYTEFSGFVSLVYGFRDLSRPGR